MLLTVLLYYAHRKVTNSFILKIFKFYNKKNIMDIQAQCEEFLKNLKQKDYSGEWFFEQWSNNQTISFLAFEELSIRYMDLLIIKLRDYLYSQNFFYFNQKSKIQRCIEDLEKQRKSKKEEKSNNEIRGSQQIDRQIDRQIKRAFQQALASKERAALAISLIGCLSTIIVAIVSIVTASNETNVIGFWVQFGVELIKLIIFIIFYWNILTGEVIKLCQKLNKLCSKTKNTDENKQEGPRSDNRLQEDKLGGQRTYKQSRMSRLGG